MSAHFLDRRSAIQKQVDEDRFRCFQEAQAEGLGRYKGDSVQGGVVTMNFAQGLKRYSLPDGSRLEK